MAFAFARIKGDLWSDEFRTVRPLYTRELRRSVVYGLLIRQWEQDGEQTKIISQKRMTRMDIWSAGPYFRRWQLMISFSPIKGAPWLVERTGAAAMTPAHWSELYQQSSNSQSQQLGNCQITAPYRQNGAIPHWNIMLCYRKLSGRERSCNTVPASQKPGLRSDRGIREREKIFGNICISWRTKLLIWWLNGKQNSLTWSHSVSNLARWKNAQLDKK